MKLLIVTETLYPRGAETFVVRLANALSAIHDVTVLNLHPYWSKAGLTDQLEKKIQLIERTSSYRWFKQKFDGLFLKLGIDKSIVEADIVSYIHQVITENNIDVVHSHLFKADYYVARVKTEYQTRFNHVTTNHGDYLLFNRQAPARILNYKNKLHFLLARVNHVVNISDEQLQLFSSFKQEGDYPFKSHKVLNGYQVYGNGPVLQQRKDLGIAADAFVFGMVASGIKEKGWDEAIRAFELLDAPNAVLLLVGEGKRLDELKSLYAGNKQIIFTGYVKHPLAYIACFDIGLLPSYYAAESLPTSIIEYLYMSRPVIATAVGEVERMLQTGHPGELAGKIIHFNKHTDIVPSLVAEMRYFITNPEYVIKYQQYARKAFEKFEMNRCVDAYLDIYSANF